MNFTRLAGQAELTPIDVTTDGEGIARAELLAPRTPEVATIQAQSGAITQQLDVETALVNPNAAGGYVGNFPNPFHPEENPTTIAYKLDDDAKVRLRIFTLTGGLVLDETVPKGDVGAQQGLNQYLWDGKNGDGEFVASGGYILLIEAEGSGETLHTMRRKIGVVR
jgi:flagellar hook assembly protein FlgD